MAPGSDEHTLSSSISSWSSFEQSTGQPDNIRVFVRLDSGANVVVSVNPRASVLEVHRQAIRRAIRNGYHLSVENSTLLTLSDPPVSLFDEDVLLDVLDLTSNNTLRLAPITALSSLGSPSMLSLPTTGASSGELHSLVYIRWVTLEEAMSVTCLANIEADSSPVSSNTPLDQIYKITLNKATAHYGKEPRQVRLYTKSTLLTAQNNPATLRELKLEGQAYDPLTIFVDADFSSGNTAVQEIVTTGDLSQLWGFPITHRGLSTVTSSLVAWLRELDLDSALPVIFEVTHFPPLLLALSQLRGDVDIEALLRSGSSDLRMVVHAIYHLCVQMTPSAICLTPAMALQSSRQIIVWLSSLEAKSTAEPTVYTAKISDDRHGSYAMVDALSHSFKVPLSVVSPSDTNPSRVMTIVLGENDHELATSLVKSIHRRYSTNYDYYIKYTGSQQTFVQESRRPAPQPADFDFLLKTTALSEKLRMVGANQIGKVIATQLPIITLSETGLVSICNQESAPCEVPRFYTHNCIDKKIVLKQSDPGEYLSQKLEPIIEARKKDNTWVLDASVDWTSPCDIGQLDEAILVVMDSSYSMGNSMNSDWITYGDNHARLMPSRLTEVKEFFKHLSLRVSALQLSTFLGLVTFSEPSQVATRQPLGPCHLGFEKAIEEVKVQSNTAIYNGLSHAVNLLKQARTDHPDVKCRIIVLTDGQDNRSTVQPHTIGKLLVEEGIVMDAIIIGTTATEDLFKISNMTGGYAFAPASQESLFQIFLLENMVDVRTRPVPCKATGPWALIAPKANDMPNAYTFPACRPHLRQKDSFIALTDAYGMLSRRNMSNNGMSTSGTSESGRTSTTIAAPSRMSSGASGTSRVVLNEIREVINHHHNFMDIYISESNMGFWQVVMQGPPASAYEKGNFLLYIEIGQDFPLRPPAARFITSVLHPNVTKHGRICSPIFDREWTGDMRVYEVLQHIWGIFMSIEVQGAIDPLSTLKFWTDPIQGRAEVEKYVDKFATRSRAELRGDILAEDDTENDDVDDDVSMNSNTTQQPNRVARPRRGPGSAVSGYLSNRRDAVPFMST